jgi:uncharacterized iron-regulated protein
MMQEMSEKVQEESLSIYDALINEGMEQGERRKTIQGIQNALKKQKYSIEEIAAIFEVSEEFVRLVQQGEVK